MFGKLKPLVPVLLVWLLAVVIVSAVAGQTKKNLPEPQSPAKKIPGEKPDVWQIDFRNAEAQLKNLKSYRVHYLYKDQDRDMTGERRADFIEYHKEINNTTGDRHLYLNQQGGLAVGIFNDYRINGMYYTSLEGSKSGNFALTAMPAETHLPFEPIDVCRATGFGRARLLAKGEKVGDIATDHYVYEKPAPPSRWDLKTLKGEVWLAQEGGYVVKYLIEGTNIDTAATRWEYTVEAVNSINEIKMP